MSTRIYIIWFFLFSAELYKLVWLKPAMILSFKRWSTSSVDFDRPFTQSTLKIKQAQSFLDNWDKHPEVLTAMMESDIDPNNPEYSNNIPMEMEQPEVSVRAELIVGNLNQRLTCLGQLSIFWKFSPSLNNPSLYRD